MQLETRHFTFLGCSDPESGNVLEESISELPQTTIYWSKEEMSPGSRKRVNQESKNKISVTVSF